MKTETSFHYASEKPGYAQDYLQPEFVRWLGSEKQKILEIGCDNGAVA